MLAYKKLPHGVCIEFLGSSPKVEKYNLMDLKKSFILLAINLDILKLFLLKFCKLRVSSTLMIFFFTLTGYS